MVPNKSIDMTPRFKNKNLFFGWIQSKLMGDIRLAHKSIYQFELNMRLSSHALKRRGFSRRFCINKRNSQTRKYMSYNIVLTNGTSVTLVPDDTVNTTALSINIFGRGYVNYGMALNENFVYMLEHFADPNPPTVPVHGQLWYNTTIDALSVWSISNVWTPLQYQNNLIGSEITVQDGNGNSAELDGTGNLYIQSSNPSINFMNNFSNLLSSQPTTNIIGKIYLTSDNVVEITPALRVSGNANVGNIFSVGNTINTVNLNVYNNAVVANLSVTGSELISNNLTVGQSIVGNQITSNGIILAQQEFLTQASGSSFTSSLRSGGILYLQTGISPTNNISGPSIIFSDYTGATEGAIVLVAPGATGWNAGAGGPYALRITPALDVGGNCLIEGNLTVNGTIDGGQGFLPLAGGTMTGNLVMNDCNISLNDSQSPSISLYATSPSGTETGVAFIGLTVDNVGLVIEHAYLNGDHALILANIVSVDITNPSVDIFAPTNIDGTLGVWVQAGNAAISGIFTHYETTGRYPTFFLGDPGSGAYGHTFGTDGVLVACQLQGTSTTLNNYQLVWGIANNNTATGVVTSPLMRLDIATGNLGITGGLTQNSDQRLKTEIEKVENSLDIIGEITGVKYTRIDNGQRNIGFLAQEVQKVLPEVVHEDANGLLSIAYANMIPVCLNAINELRARVEELEKKL